MPMKPDTSQDQQRRFLEIRRRGRARYVWYFGILRFGGFFTLLMGPVWYALVRGSYPPLIGSPVPPLLAWILYMVPFSALGGFLYGRWMWRIFERNTRNLVEQANGGSAPA